MADNFPYDVFLSYSAKDKAVIRPLAERLRADGLHVWFDDWVIKSRITKANRAEKVEEGLEHSRVLVLCMSAHAFGSDWLQLEASTFRFRDPLNEERRLILLRLDNAPIKGSLAQFRYINWRPEGHQQEYANLLEACRPPTEKLTAEAVRDKLQERDIQLYEERIYTYAFSSDGKHALTGAGDKTVRLWDLETERCLRVFEGHTGGIQSLALSTDQCRALSGAEDNTARLWDVKTGSCLRVLEGHLGGVLSVALSADQRRALSGAGEGIVRLWDMNSGKCLQVLEGHSGYIQCVAWSSDQRRALSGAGEGIVRLWDLDSGKCLQVLEGHLGYVQCVAWSADQQLVLSGGHDRTVRLWDIETGRCLLVLEGHTGQIWSVAWSTDQRRALSSGNDRTVRLWDVETGRCLRVFRGHTAPVWTVAWSANRRSAFSGDERGGIRAWDLTEFVTAVQAVEASTTASPFALDQVQYTNAKVLIVGESGAGKTGISRRLASNDWQPTDSTVGAWATQWQLPVAAASGVEKEIWLWDFGGQADQRLIHQLYMEDTALAVLVFDGQKEDLFETLGQWDRDLTRASRQAFTKLLVAGRVDAGGLRISRNQIEGFAKERGFAGFFETSAKTSLGCEELKQAILNGIRWEDIPWRSSPILFKRLKEEIVRLKDTGRVLMRFNELREMLQLRLLEENGSEGAQFADEELRAVVGLLSGPGVVWELAFGSWVLLQPEQINAYAQAVIQTLRAEENERGIIPEERVLSGALIYHSSIQRLDVEDERFVLLAMLQMLLERGLCLREYTDKGGPVLIFPSHYGRERPELVEYPTVLVSYRFNGFLDDIYATLVVRLHYTKLFQQDQLWRYAVDFRTTTGKQLGLKLSRRTEGAGELELYFDSEIPLSEKIVFSRFVHEHLLRNARNVVRLRHFICPYCSTPVGNRDVAMRRLEEDKKDILCVNCEKRIPLWDELEMLFASPETRQRVRQLEEQSAVVLDNESKERALVGEVITTVALAGQISREFNTSDHGIDMEIEFKDATGQATGRKIYLQLRAGDSYLRKRRRDGAEVFMLKNERLATYWMAQPFPVMLVIRTSDGEVRWMEVRDWLKRASDNGRKPVRQIVFEGERLDVMSVLRWRDPMARASKESLTAEATRNLDANIRLSSLERLVTSWPDDETRDLLLQRCTYDLDERIRITAAKKLEAMWPDDKTRAFLVGIAEADSSAEVRAVACEVLSNRWWRELGIRKWLRVRIGLEADEAIQGRLIRAVESAGGQVSDFWEAKLSGQQNAEREPETLPGYPAFRVSRFRLRNIGPFQDTQEVDLRRDANIFLGDNAAGKTTILRCLALATVGQVAANEVEDQARAYLRKGELQGTIEVLFELVPDPETLPAEVGYFAVGLQIVAGSSRFSPLPDSAITLRRPDLLAAQLVNSAEHLGALRSERFPQFGFVSGYGAVRTFSESRFALQAEVAKTENEWILSLFRPDAWLINPEVFTKMLRGDTSNIDGSPPEGFPIALLSTLHHSLKHLVSEVENLFDEGDDDLRLNGMNLRFGELSDGYRSLFALLGHLLRCSMRIRNWEGDPAQVHGIILVDEIDLHLHPAWQSHVVQDFLKAFPNIQLIASTHSPLVVGALKREHVLIMRSEEDGHIMVNHPEFDPQGLGVAGILTNIFNLSSTIDQPTLDKINRRLFLHSNRLRWTAEEDLEYRTLTDDLAKLGFGREFSDPYFERFAVAMAKRHRAALERLDPRENLEIDSFADQLLDEIMNEDIDDPH